MTNNTYILNALQERFGSALWKKWQMHRWPYFDYVRLTNAGIDELNFFVNPIGSTDPVSSAAKTLEQTNMDKARSFGQVYYFINQIRTHIFVLPKNRQPSGISSDADVLTSADGMVLITPELQQLSYLGVLELSIGQKDYYPIQQPFRYAPQAFGVDITRHAASGITESSWWQGNTDQDNAYTLTPPQLIEPEQNFNCSIKFPEGNTPTFPQVASADVRIDIGVIFDGYIIRPAQ